MIEHTIKSELHCCDLCRRRIPSTGIKTCCVCRKELCAYCRIALSRVFRKHPDSGYITYYKIIGYICLECSNKKLKTKEVRQDGI